MPFLSNLFRSERRGTSANEPTSSHLGPSTASSSSLYFVAEPAPSPSSAPGPAPIMCAGCSREVQRAGCTFCVHCCRAICSGCAPALMHAGRSRCPRCAGGRVPAGLGSDLPAAPVMESLAQPPQPSGNRSESAVLPLSPTPLPPPLEQSAARFSNPSQRSGEATRHQASPPQESRSPLATEQPLVAAAAAAGVAVSPQVANGSTELGDQRGTATVDVTMMDGSSLAVFIDDSRLRAFGVKQGSCVCIVGGQGEDDHVAIVAGVSPQGRLVVNRLGDPYSTFVPPQRVGSLVVLEYDPQPSPVRLEQRPAGTPSPPPPAPRSVGSPHMLQSSDSSASNGNLVASSFEKYSRLNDLEVLGQGAQGVVWKCQTTDGEIVVRKEMIFSDRDVSVFHTRLAQAERVMGFCHDHLIRYLAVFHASDPLRISIVMPYYEESDLEKLVARHVERREPFPHLRTCSIILQVASALAYLHSQTPPVAHRDTKLSNIIAFEGGERTLLMDLDTSRTADDGRAFTAGVGTMEFLAPEALTAGGAGLLSDIFSLGVVFLQIVALLDVPLLPHNGTATLLSHSEWQPAELAAAVQAAVADADPTTPNSIVKLIVAMLNHRPTDRPTARQVCDALEDIMEVLLTSPAAS